MGPVKSPDTVPPFLQRSLFPLKPAGAAQPAADETPFKALTDVQKQQTMACYASTGVDIEARVVDVTRTTADPQDPAFYGTCLQKITGRNLGLNAASGASAPIASTFFVTSVGCISCADRKLYDLYNTLVPQWTAVSESCVHCDIEPGVLPTAKAAQVRDQVSFLAGDKTALTAAQLPWTRVAARDNTVCDPAANTCGTGGAASTAACAVTLQLLGAPTDTISPEECMRMAQRRGFAEATLNAATSTCSVNKTDACCGACKTVASTGPQTLKVPAMPSLPTALDLTDMLPQLQRAADPNKGTAPTIPPTSRPDGSGAPGGAPGAAPGTGGADTTSTGSNFAVVAGAAGGVVALVALVALQRRRSNAAVGSYGVDAKHGGAVMAPYGQQQYGQQQAPGSYNPHSQQQQQQQMPW